MGAAALRVNNRRSWRVANTRAIVRVGERLNDDSWKLLAVGVPIELDEQRVEAIP